MSISGIRYTIKKEHERQSGVSKPRSGRPRKLDETNKQHLMDAITNNPKVTWEDLLSEVLNKVKSGFLLYYNICLLTSKTRSNMNQFAGYCMLRTFKNGVVVGDLIWLMSMQQNIYVGHKNIDILELLTGLCLLVWWITVERGIGIRQEWTFTRPKNQVREGQCQGLPHRGKQVKRMFGGAFSGATRWTGLIPLFGNPNAERTGITGFVIWDLYLRILPTLIDHEDGIFQHDNAPTHTAYVVRDVLADMGLSQVRTIQSISIQHACHIPTHPRRPDYMSEIGRVCGDRNLADQHFVDSTLAVWLSWASLYNEASGWRAHIKLPP